ncbi:MAG: multidrug effflux MFS transporter, partial [Ottowia sp.]|nr:multidrug effflux MFS transporter [Ottowia sp.]
GGKNMKFTEKHPHFILIWILAYMSAMAPLATDMYLPSMGDVQQTFGTTQANVQLTITVFFVAFSFGQLIYGPLSDALGRRKPLAVGIAIYTLASFACAFAPSIWAFVALRFLQALGGCAGVVMARAIINDKFDLKEGASVLAIMMMVGALAPMLAPSLGGLVVKFAPWPAVFVLLGVFGVLLLVFMYFGLEETSNPAQRTPLNISAVFENYFAILDDRRFLLLVLTLALPLAALFAYITAASFVFQDYYGLSKQAFGVVFGINALGGTIFATVNAKIVRKISPYIVLHYAFIVMLVFVCLLMAGGFLGFGFLWFEVFVFLTNGMIGFIAPNATVLAMDRFRKNSGSASALLGMIQFAVAGFVSFLAGALHANTPAKLAAMMGACILSGYAVYLLLQRASLRRRWRRAGQ